MLFNKAQVHNCMCTADNGSLNAYSKVLERFFGSLSLELATSVGHLPEPDCKSSPLLFILCGSCDLVFSQCVQSELIEYSL